MLATTTTLVNFSVFPQAPAKPTALSSPLEVKTTIDALAGGKSAFIVNQLNSGPIFTASASGTPKFTINNLGTITLANNTIITDDTNYTRFSRGIAVGSNETYYFNASGNINANNLTLSGTTTLNGLTYTWLISKQHHALTTNDQNLTGLIPQP